MRNTADRLYQKSREDTKMRFQIKLPKKEDLAGMKGVNKRNVIQIGLIKGKRMDYLGLELTEEPTDLDEVKKTLQDNMKGAV